MRFAISAGTLVLALCYALDAQPSRLLSNAEHDAFIETGYTASIPPDPKQVRAKFGPPRSQERSMVPNRHVPGQQDAMTVFHYSGFEIHFYETPTATFVTKVVINSPNFSVQHDMKVGTAETRVRTLLGMPSRTDSGGITFEPLEGAYSSVTFELSKGRVSRIVWDLPLD